MTRDRYDYAITQVSARPLIQRALVAMLALTGITLMMLEHSQSPATQRIRTTMLDVLNPVLSVMSQPVAAIHDMTMAMGDYRNAVEENRRLKIENERLMHWQSAALALKAENDALRALAEYHPVESTSFVTARVIGQSPSAYSQTLTINAGSEEGLSSLQPVVDSYGLVGRLTDVGAHTSRVLLLSDTNSRVPVMSADSRQHAILAGTGDSMLRLMFITADQAKMDLGETVMTTAEGNLIPGGIAVGQVFSSDATGYLVNPVRPLAQADYVRVITQVSGGR